MILRHHVHTWLYLKPGQCKRSLSVFILSLRACKILTARKNSLKIIYPRQILAKDKDSLNAAGVFSKKLKLKENYAVLDADGTCAK